ncbi:MAG: hypothetical protein HC883_04725 [Bdellovibrionaceae bacterium]|nr:hypothetical protein [Pseudobdellovibrionaceae bacterium]
MKKRQVICLESKWVLLDPLPIARNVPPRTSQKEIKMNTEVIDIETLESESVGTSSW